MEDKRAVPNELLALREAGGGLLYRIGCDDLVEMMDQMGEVIGRQKAKCDWLSGSDSAKGFQFGSRQVGDYMSEIAIVGGPNGNQQQPIGFLNGLHAHVSVLVITWEVQRFLKCCPDESLVVVGCRIDQMSDDLPARPAARQNGLPALNFADSAKPPLRCLNGTKQLLTELFHLSPRRTIIHLY